MLQIDHAMLVTGNIEKTQQDMRARYGLGCLQGGLHPDGTRTWVIPLGGEYTQYIEILTIEEPARAARDFFGSWLLERVTEEASFVGWALQTDDIDPVCTRLNIPSWTGSVSRPDGSSSSWSEAGFEQAATSGWLPFFIAYNDREARRRRAQTDLQRVEHGIEPCGIAWIELGGNGEQLHKWLGDETLPVRVVSEQPGVYGVGIRTAQGEVVMR